MATMQPSLLHWDSLPPEPQSWKQMLKHLFVTRFRQVTQREYTGLKEKGTFIIIDLPSPDQTILPVLWVFKYKFNTDRYLTKFKACLCVRGDLQTTDQDTYAATLATRTFRALMAIAAAFGLRMRQYDAVNAFANSPINEVTYCWNPEGFSNPSCCLQLL